MTGRGTPVWFDWGKLAEPLSDETTFSIFEGRPLPKEIYDLMQDLVEATAAARKAIRAELRRRAVDGGSGDVTPESATSPSHVSHRRTKRMHAVTP